MTLQPATEGLHRLVRAFRQLGELEQLVRPATALRTRQAEIPTVEDEVLADRQLRVERVLLRHDAEPCPDLRAVRSGIQAEDGENPVADRRDAADHAHGRGLAGAVRAEEAERFAGSHVEVDGVDRDELAEALGQAAGMDERRGGLGRHG